MISRPILTFVEGVKGAIVHRLDYETSGALIFALTQEYWKELRKAFYDKKVRKVYHAIVCGNPGLRVLFHNIDFLENQSVFEGNLRVQRTHPAYVVVVNEEQPENAGYPTRTNWTVLKRDTQKRYALVEV